MFMFNYDLVKPFLHLALMERLMDLEWETTKCLSDQMLEKQQNKTQQQNIFYHLHSQEISNRAMAFG